jgi:hypothetical protein
MTEAKVKSNSVMTVKQMDGKLVFTFLGAGEFTFDPDKASAENRARAMMHGFKQRIADGAALSRDTTTGLAATPEEKMAEARKIAEHYESGSTDWALKVAEGGAADGTWLTKALVALGKAATVEEAMEKVVALAGKKFGGETGKARKALLADPKVAKAVLDLKAAAIKADSSADSMLDEI